ncbi:hypothetical protein HBI88_037760 [Parastagonospora nodorum]|nr:hypothetical protein HBI88_037760 [Parastagonospora nodorum]KAH5956150.1 hypothetical protein HBI85_198840 [Parastagonospora nodorum]
MKVHLIRLRRLQKCIRTADAERIVRGLENSAPASLLVYSDYALQEYSLLNVRHVQRPADAYNKTGTHRALIGTVLYNTIKEYYDDGTRKTIYFYGHTVEDDYHNNDEETRVRLRESLGEIHDILLREFRRADDFTESVIYNDDEQV